MARKFKTVDIVAPVKARLSKRSLTHINTAFDDLSEDIILGLSGNVYDPSAIFILYGCDVTITGGSIPGTGTASITEGAVYYNGRIYKVDQNNSLSTTNPQTLRWEIVETTISGDPATFDDGNTYDFHIIEKMALVAGTAGSGLANYDATTVKYLDYEDAANNSLTSASVTNCALTSGQYNAKRHGGIIDFSLRATFTVTTGASAASLELTAVTGMDFANSTKAIGTFRAWNNTTNARIADTIITNALNSTDVDINSSGRIVITIAAGTVANGDTVQVIAQFTADASGD